MPTPRVSTIVLSAVGVLFVVLIVSMVASSLVRPQVETFTPSPPSPEEVGEGLVGPLEYTVDATSNGRWVYFDLSRGSVVAVESARSLDWDVAFQRHRMITNGGATNPLGLAGVLDLGPVSLDSALELPDSGYVTDEQRGDSPRNRVLEDWYDYSWISHVLRPADRTFALRTADGKYAVMRFLGYYCPGGRPGCISFRYRYRGDGANRFGSSNPAPDRPARGRPGPAP
jgi:hypothetical protein